MTEPVWLEPYPETELADDTVGPEARYQARESVELAFVAALQHLPARRRAVLILREVLQFSAAEVADVPAMVGLLAEDARFSMSPLPAWFRGRDDVLRFMTERMWATPWLLVPVRQRPARVRLLPGGAAGEPYRLSAVNVVTLRAGRIAELTGFLDPAVCRRFGLPPQFPGS